MPALESSKGIVKKVTKISLAILLPLALTLSCLWTQDDFGAEKMIAEAEEALAQVDNYTAIFHKQERIKGILNPEETIVFKFKKPFKVYMKWVKNPYKGRESLYVEGANDNRIKAHEGGIISFVEVDLDPLSSRAMKGNRHSITDSGLDNLVKLIGKEMRRGIAVGEMEFIDHGQETVYGRTARKIEGIFPRDKEKGYYCYRAVISFDIELKVPIKSKIYDWENLLIENYGYEDLKLNAGLTDFDFDPKNPEYKF